MRNTLLVLLLLCVGCAKEGQSVKAKVTISTDKPSKAYPVSDMYGRHTLPGFVDTNCHGIYDSQCEKAYIDYFGQKLIGYYSKTHFAVRICDQNPYVCSRDWNMEDFVRNYGVL